MGIVKDILIVEKTDTYVLRAKSGWTDATTPGTGWYVGYLERGDDLYVFATNLDIVQDEDVRARIAVTRNLLGSLGLLDD